jgi:hypothetical protein
MNIHPLALRLFQHTRAGLCAAALLMAALAGPARAQDDPPGRVGRLADLQGAVSWFDAEQGLWLNAERNRPLTSGDRLSTAPQGRAELRVGSTVLRLAGGSELELLRLDDQRISVQLHSGSLALRVRSREVASEIDIVTQEARLMPLRSGHYRVDRIDDSTQASTWRGDLRVDDGGGLVIAAGQRAELWREGPARSLRFAWNSPPSDYFANWVVQADARDERSVSSRYVSPEMTGAEELDRNGRWDRHPEYGAVWFPLEVRVGWAPYRFGRWSWVGPWGWTWVDEAAWGFAPFHYGRWISVSGRWGWVPGAYVARPVFAPALVAWVGGSHGGVSVSIGGPTVGWLPLAPREVYVPHYRHTPVYGDRINARPPQRGHDERGGARPGLPGGAQGPQVPAVPQVPVGPVMYGNQGVPGAVTVVPRDVLLQRQPVPHSVQNNTAPGGVVQAPFSSVAPPQAPTRAAPQPTSPGPVLGTNVEQPREPGRDMQRGRNPNRDVNRELTREVAVPPSPRQVETGPVVVDLRRERGTTPATPPAAAPTAPPTATAAPVVAPASPSAQVQVPRTRARPPEPDAARPAEPAEAREDRKRAPEGRNNQRERENQR